MQSYDMSFACKEFDQKFKNKKTMRFSGQYFSVFELIRKMQSVNLRRQFRYGKYRP